MILQLLSALWLPTLLTLLAWLGGVIYFQQADVEPTPAELLGGFVLLPLALLLGYGLLRWSWRHMQARKQAAASADGSAATPAAAASTEDESRFLKLQLLLAELHTPAGDDAATLISAMQESSLRPALNLEQLDSEGLPLRMSMDAQLDTAAAQAWLDRHHTHTPHTLEPARLLRLLAMLDAPLEAAAEVLAQLPVPQVGEPRLSGDAQPQPVLPVHARLCVPEAARPIVAAYVRDKFAALPQAAVGLVQDLPAASGHTPDLLQVVDAFCQGSTREYADAVLLIVASDSLVDESSLAALEASNTLYTARTPLGKVPGEAAAVILAVAPALAARSPCDVLAQVHRVAAGVRQKPLSASGRVEASTLESLSALALQAARVEAAQIAALFSDCDHRANWQLEAASLISSSLPELDPVEQHLATGSALGNLGEAHAAVAMALAARHVAEHSNPVLLACMHDVQWRSLTTLSPPTQDVGMADS
ncbi:hypothetical protein [Uliginosibacterium sediminicola]|uniref:Uncharacterized protein n=1 Tax=Uliginosibacterium sediminicola TaxID=2024550 RepID=A0ABU9Z131_9RHOO